MDSLFDYTFFQNALIGVIIVGIASAVIGTYIVTRRLVFITGGITHACFGGLGLGYFIGAIPILMAGLFAVASSLGVQWLSAKENMREDSAIAVVWALGMAIGTIFIFLTPGYVPELNSFLFGNILTITHADLLAFAIFTVVLILFFAIFYRQIIAIAFDRDFARTMRLPVTFINTAMTFLMAICVVLTVRLIGIMLLMAMMTLPQLIAEIFASRFRLMMILSVLMSVGCSVAGLLLSCLFSVPASATIVIVLVAVYFVARSIKAVIDRRFTSNCCNIPDD